MAAAPGLVEALLEAARGIETEQQQGTHIEEERERDGEDSIGEVLFSEIRHRGIVIEEVSTPAAASVVVESWSEYIGRDIYDPHVGEEVEGGQDAYQGHLDVPHLSEAMEADVEWPVYPPKDDPPVMQSYQHKGDQDEK